MALIMLPYAVFEVLGGDTLDQASWATNFIKEYQDYKQSNGELNITDYGKQLNTPVAVFTQEVEFGDEIATFAIDAYIFAWAGDKERMMFKLKYA